MKDKTKKRTRTELETSAAGDEFTPDISDILDALPFYVLLVDETHHILNANRAVWTHLGVVPEEVKGKYCPKVIHGLDGPFEGCPLEEAAASGRAIEKEVLDQNGRWLCSAIYPIQGLTREGKRIFFHMVTDITERKRAEEQLEASHEQLRSLSTHLESLREEERRIRGDEPAYTEDEYRERLDYYLSRIPYKLLKMRYSSFARYFGHLKRLGWVEEIGKTEPSAIQDDYPPAPSRVFYRLTLAGWKASTAEISDPIMTLYQYSREQRSAKRTRYSRF